MAQDLETKDDGLNRNIGAGWAYRLGHVIGVAYAAEGIAGYIPLRGDGAFPTENVARWLRDHNHVPTVFHNAPYDCGWRSVDLGVEAPDVIHDTQCEAVMVNENRLTYALDDVCQWLGVPGKDKRLLYEVGAAYGVKRSDIMKNLWRFENRHVGPYATQDAVSTLQSHEKLAPMIEAEGSWDAYRTECDLIPMVVEMRRRGVRVDVGRALEAADKIEADMIEMLADLGHRLAIGRPLEFADVMSGQRLKAFFDQEQVPYPKERKKRKRDDESEGVGYSFESQWMSNHPHWLPQTVAKIRSGRDAAQKFLRTYIAEYANNGRIHAEIHPYRSDDGGTRSHRFSYSDPPLQQMPGDRLPLLKKIVRGIFLPEEGEYWLAADYSQQEPRLLVHYAVLSEILGWEKAHDYYWNDPAPDYHTMVAKLTGLPRPQAKIINLGMMYGMGVVLLCASLGLSESEGKKILGIYHEELPIVKGLSDECSAAAQRRGFIKLLDGARCHFDQWELQRLKRHPVSGEVIEKWTTKEFSAAQAEWRGRPVRRAFTHKAMNRLIQGSAARQTKRAMLALWREKILPLLQMHDELDFSIAGPEIIPVIVEIMRDVVQLKIPMRVDAEVGRTWGSAVNKEWSMRDAA